MNQSNLKPYQGAYQSDNPNPYKLSRTKVENFLDCPRCFYLDRVHKIARPSTPPFTINSAVDSLLKAEFDTHRANGRKHPIQEEYGIDAEPASHELLDKWRENFHGIQYLDKKNNLLLFGALDDLWINSAGEYIVVDYKATAKAEPVESLGEARWHDAYRRQIEFYQWLLRQNGYKVSNTGYWVYCTGRPNEKAFNKRVIFDLRLIEHMGNDSWVEPTIAKLKACLDASEIPPVTSDCEYCNYVSTMTGYEG